MPPLRHTPTQLADYMRDVGPAGIVLFEATPPFRVLSTNKAYLELWPEPLRSAGLVGLALSEFIPDAEDSGVAEVFREVARTRTTRHVHEFPYHLADGTHWFNWSLSPVIREGEVVALANMSVDITREVLGRRELERAHAEQGEAAARYERQVRLFDGVASTTPDFVYLFDLQGRFLYANRRLLEVWGMQLSEVTGKTFRELGYEQWHHDRHTREIAQVIATKQPIKGEVPFKAPLTGIFGVYEYIFTPVIDAQGEVEIIAGTTRDVTARKRAEEALQRANEQLREASRRKDDFLGMLSHELRNPLAPIRTSTHVLQHAAPGSEQARRAQTVIQRQTEHLTRLVDDLLDVTRVARGKIELRRAHVDLRGVVARAAEDFRVLLHDRGVRFEVAIPDDELQADADPTRITQIVGNLLHNASKFTRSGDTVALSIAASEGGIEITVRDTGRGIDPELLPNVFEPFVQGERTLARTEGGLGLGLALVKGITELHGGTVQARSAGEGRGAEFIVRLPRPPASEPRATAASSGVDRRNAGRRVLVVDDNVDAAESLADLVRMLGHEVLVVFDGAGAVETARKSRPDVVLCDIGLPGMDGYAVASAIRASGFDGVQLVAVTGYAQPEDVKKAVEAGFDAHVAKPPDPAQIERLLA